MNITKEEMLNALTDSDANNAWAGLTKEYCAIRALVESSGEKGEPRFPPGVHDVDEDGPPAPSPAPSVERREGHCALKYDKTTRTIKTFDPNPAPLPKEVEEAMDTLHEAAYDGLCYKYHAKDNVEWWDAVLKAEVVIKAALGKQAPLPAEVEDAMGRIAGAIAGDYCHLKNAKYEKAQVEYDANRAALAVIKAAIRPKIITEE
jgi:hypothetical protein